MECYPEYVIFISACFTIRVNYNQIILYHDLKHSAMQWHNELIN